MATGEPLVDQYLTRRDAAVATLDRNDDLTNVARCADIALISVLIDVSFAAHNAQTARPDYTAAVVLVMTKSFTIMLITLKVIMATVILVVVVVVVVEVVAVVTAVVVVMSLTLTIMLITYKAIMSTVVVVIIASTLMVTIVIRFNAIMATL